MTVVGSGTDDLDLYDTVRRGVCLPPKQPQKRHPMTLLPPQRQRFVDIILLLGLAASICALTPGTASADSSEYQTSESSIEPLKMEVFPIEDDPFVHDEPRPIGVATNQKTELQLLAGKSASCDSYDPLFLTGPEVNMITDTGLTGSQISYVVGNVTAHFTTGLEIEPGGEYITAIQFAAGSTSRRGHPASVTLFANPDTDFTPSTAYLVHHEHGFVDPDGAWTTIELREPVYIGPAGTKFFAGVVIRQEFASQAPMRTANNAASEGRSWDRASLGSNFDVATKPTSTSRPSSQVYPIRAIGRSTDQIDCHGIARMDTCDIPCTSTLIQRISKTRHYDYSLDSSFFYNVRFSGPVTGVTTEAFGIATTGTLSGYSISSVSGSGENYLVEIPRTEGRGVGELKLTKGDLSGVLDDLGDPVADFFPRVEPYRVNHQATRLVSSSTLPGPVPGFELTFNSPLIERPDVSLSFQNYFDVPDPTIDTVEFVGTSPHGTALSLDAFSADGTAVAATGEYFPNDEYTIEAWINLNSHVGDAPIIDFRNGSGDRVIFAFGGTGSRYLIFESLNSGSTPAARRVFAMLTVPLETWVHVAATVKDGRVDLYINGVLQGSGEIEELSSGLMDENNIGQRLTITDARFDGDMDNLRIWSRGLDAVEISETMNVSAYTTGTTDLVAQWTFDEGTGTVASDSSGNDHDITLLPDAGWTGSGVPFTNTIRITLSDVTAPSHYRISPILEQTSSEPPNYFGRSYEGLGTSSSYISFTMPYYTGLPDPAVTSITRLADELTNSTSFPFKVGVNDILVDVPTDDLIPVLTGDLGSATISSNSFRTTDTIWFSGSAGSHIRIPNLLAIIPNEEITIEFWQRALQTTSQATIRSASDLGDNRVTAHVPWSTGDVIWDFGTWSSTGRLLYTPPENIIKEWNHFALVASNSGDFMRIYRNGVLEAEKFEASAFINRDDDLLLAFFEDQFTHLLLREYRIWSRALDGNEIRDLRFDTPDVNDPDLFLYYSFTEFEDLGVGGEGFDIRDLSLNANHAHLVSPDSGTSLVPSSAPFRITVDQPDGEDGTLRLDVVDTDTILFKDATPLGGTGTGNGDFTTGEVYQINREDLVPVIAGNDNPTNIVTNNLTVTFNKSVGGISAGDFITTNVLSLDVSGGPDTFDVEVTADGEGSVSIQLPAGVTTDAYTNSNTASNVFTYIYDTTPPTGTISINGGDAFTSTTEVLVTNNITDSLSGVAEMRFRNDGGTWSPWEAFEPSTSWTLASVEGTRDVEGEFRDAAGNVHSASDTILLDVTPPSGTFVINDDDDYTNNPDVVLTMSISDAGGSGLAEMRFRNNGGTWSPWIPYDSTANWNLGTSEGTRVVQGQFRDGALNVHDTNDLIILDTTPPTGTLTVNDGDEWTSQTSVQLDLAFTDNLSGVDEMRFSNDGSTWSPWEPYDTTQSWVIDAGDGSKTIFGEIRDAAGNVAQATTTIGLDTVEPEVILTINDGDAWTNNLVVAVDVLTTPGISGASALQLQSTDPLLPELPWEPFSSEVSFTLEDGNGLREVTGFVRDATGNIGSASSSIMLDTLPPTGTVVVNSGDDFTNNPTVTLDLTATDGGGIGVGDMRFSNDGSDWSPWVPFTTTTTWDLDDTSDGTKTVFVQFRDLLGNTSVAYTDTIFLDTTAPIAAMEINGADDFTSSLGVSLTITASDQGGSGIAEMSFSNDGISYTSWEPFETTQSWTLASGADGPRSVYLRLRDNLGNEPASGITAIGVIGYDTTPPTGTVTINNGDTWTSQTVVNLTLNSVDNLSGTTGMRFSNDSITWGPWQPYDTSTTWTINSGDGNRIVYAQYRDAVGNTSPGGLDIFDSILLDQTPPTGSIEIQTDPGCPGWIGSPNVTLLLSANDGAGIGLGDMRFRNEGMGPWSSWIPYNTTHPWTLEPVDGTRSVEVQYRDQLGNTSVIYSTTVELDSTPPTGTVTIVTPPDNTIDGWTSSTLVGLAITATDDLGVGDIDMRISNDEATWTSWQPLSATLPWELVDPADDFDDGLKTVYVQFRDCLGNVSASYMDTIDLDTTPPEGSIEIVVDGSIVQMYDGEKYSTGNTFTLTISADDGIGVGQIEMRLRNEDDTDWTEWTDLDTPLPWTTSSGDGPKVIFAQFRDALHNISDPVSDTVTVDTAPPTGSVEIAGGAAFVPSNEVTLNLSADDGNGSGVGGMRFSRDGSSWTSWEPYATTTSHTLLPLGEGVRGVFVQFRDNLGNAQGTTNQFDTVIVDMTPPTGTISINDGDEYATSLNANLSLSATDAGGGPIFYRLRNPGAPWTDWSPLASNVPWQLSPGDGLTTVTVQYRDSVFNLSNEYYDTILLDTIPPSIELGTPSTLLTGTGPVDIPVIYTGADTVNLASEDVLLFPSGTVTAQATVLGGSTDTPTVRLTNIGGDGSIHIRIAAGTASDLAGNLAAGAGPSAVIAVANELPGSIASAAPTRVGPPISGTYISQQGTDGLPISHVNLYVREPGLNWVNAGEVTGGTWEWTPTREGSDGNGIYQFKTIAVDTAGNMQQPVPVGAFGNSDVRVVYNHEPNAPLTLLADIGTRTMTFPMEEGGRNVVIEFVGQGVISPGSLTVERRTALPDTLPPGLDPAAILGEWLRITPGAGLDFDLVVIRWSHDAGNAPPTMGTLTTLYRSTDTDDLTLFPLVLDGDFIVSPSMPALSDWFAGDGTTTVREWLEF